MNPQSLKKLLNNPEVKELLVFIAEEAVKLNRFDDVGIGLAGVWEIALETRARQLAYKKLQDILSPLLSLKEYDRMGADKKEYMVDIKT